MKRTLAAIALGLWWIGNGSLHFFSHDEAIRQMPAWIPLQSFLVYLTGVFELALGVALVPAATRRLAAHASIALLFAFTPAVLHIVIHDVEPVDWPEGLRVFFRWGVIPLNFLFAYALYRLAAASARARSAAVG